MTTHYDVFISYRRENGSDTANLIADRLLHAGYSVFFDLESLKSGKFNEKIYGVIDSCQDFVLVLPEKGLDRCVQHDDWVRLEILRAKEGRKNIVPVMLRGFAWPSPAPQGLEDLHLYNAVAAGSIEYFDASIKRLRKFLKSKPGISWRRHRKPILATLGALILVAVTIAGWQWKSRTEFGHVCQTQASSMGLEIAKINEALTIASQAKEDWDKYWKSFPGSDPAFLRGQFVALMNHRLSNLDPLVPARAPGDETIAYLSKIGIRTDDLKALYDMAVPTALTETRKFIEKMRTFAGLPIQSPTIAQQVGADYRYLELGAKVDYVGYLKLVAEMPKQAKGDTFYKLRKELDRFRDVPPELPPAEYERMGEEILHDMENIVLELGKEVTPAALEVEGLQHVVDKYRQQEAKNAKAPDAAKNSIEAAIRRIDAKQAKLDSLIDKVDERNKALVEAYGRLVKKFSIVPGEGQWLQWGKIQRLLTNLRNTVQIRARGRTERAKNLALAAKKGLPSSAVPEPASGVPLDRMVADIDAQLDQFTKLNKSSDHAASVYATSAGRFADLLAREKVGDVGILATGTENDVPHPTLKIGDIVVARKGHPVRFVADFSAQKAGSGDDIVDVLRWDASGKLSRLRLEMPAGSPRVAFVQLRDDDE